MDVREENGIDWKCEKSREEIREKGRGDGIGLSCASDLGDRRPCITDPTAYVSIRLRGHHYPGSNHRTRCGSAPALFQEKRRVLPFPIIRPRRRPRSLRDCWSVTGTGARLIRERETWNRI